MSHGEEAAHCALCGLKERSDGAQLPGADVIVAYLDDQLIGLVPTNGPGVLLAPREHTGTLFATPERSAAILAPLRQLVSSMRSFYGVEEATIEPNIALPGAAGHVCYKVVPVLPEGEGVERSDAAARAVVCAEILRRHAAARPHPQSRSGFR